MVLLFLLKIPWVTCVPYSTFVQIIILKNTQLYLSIANDITHIFMLKWITPSNGMLVFLFFYAIEISKKKAWFEVLVDSCCRSL